MRESPPSSVPFLYQLMVGAGIPVAVHPNRATSVSFTVRVKPSVGEVMIGTTADKYNKRIIVYTQTKMEDHNYVLKGRTELKFVLFCSS